MWRYSLVQLPGRGILPLPRTYICHAQYLKHNFRCLCSVYLRLTYFFLPYLPRTGSFTSKHLMPYLADLFIAGLVPPSTCLQPSSTCSATSRYLSSIPFYIVSPTSRSTSSPLGTAQVPPGHLQVPAHLPPDTCPQPSRVRDSGRSLRFAPLALRDSCTSFSR